MNPAPEHAASWPARSRVLDALLDDAVDSRRVVGGVLLVWQQGAPVYQRAFGLADRDTRRPMRLDTLFRYSSLTKPIVSAAALALVQRGVLALQQPVTRWLPRFRPRLPDGAAPDITLHHLLTHTAGLSYNFDEDDDGPYQRAGVADGIGPSGALSLEENLARIASVPLAFAPGTAWRYSVATDVLGAVIEQASGTTLPRAVSQLVTAPLGMRDSAFHVADPGRLATAYAGSEAPPEAMSEPYRMPLPPGRRVLLYSPRRALDPQAFASGGAGMVGTAPDLLRLLEAIRSGGGPILAPALALALRSNQIGALLPDAAAPGWGFGYGGAVIVDPEAARTPQNAGTWYWGGVYGHGWFVDPARALSVVLATNTAGLSGPLGEAVREALYAGPA